MSTSERGSEAGAGKVTIFEKKRNIFPGPVIFRLRHPWRGMDVPSVFIMSMASEKMSNRSKKVLLGASDDTLKVGRSKKIGTGIFSKHHFLHKTLTKYNFFPRFPPAPPPGELQPQILAQ